MAMPLRRALRVLAIAGTLVGIQLERTVDAQSYCFDAQMNALVQCPPSGAADPAPLMKDSDDAGGRLENDKPSVGGDEGCGRGFGFCCMCHVALVSSVRAPRTLHAQVLANPATFWARHDVVARGLARSTGHRTLKARTALPASYDALLRARRPPPR